jgi:uroporphyrin-III C-methyltransferase
MSTTQSGRYGKVYLIGAGPGASDLVTVRGARVLARADVVLHDALVTDDMLELCPQAHKIAVGKRCGRTSTEQAFINKQLIDNAEKYQIVVRLKGGDPMLFGRADEELRALESHGIEVEVVPGITAALAAAAASRQPLTKRGVARSVAFFTSSTAPNHPDQLTLPDCDTLVQYMGSREAVTTARKMLALGRPPQLPVIVIENCSLEDERILRLQLGELEHGLADCHGPVLVMIGEAMAKRDVRAASSDTTTIPGAGDKAA